MFCSNCGTRIPIDSNFCTKCGQKVAKTNAHLPIDLRQSKASINESDSIKPTQSDQPENHFSSSSEFTKVWLIGLVTLGLYFSYWGWKQWALVRDIEDRKFRAGLSGFFLAFTSFSLFKELLRLSKTRASYKSNYSPVLWGSLYLALQFISNGLGREATTISWTAYLIAAFVIISIQALVLLPAISASVTLLNRDEKANKIYSALKPNYGLIAALVTIVVAYALIGAYSSS